VRVGHIGVWRDKPNYPFEFEFEIAVFWNPVLWFEPVLENLKEKWKNGMNAGAILDTENLGNTVDGMVRWHEAKKWLEDTIKYWEEEYTAHPKSKLIIDNAIDL